MLGIGELGTALKDTEAGGWLLLFWIPATLIAIVIHEAGHAFTTKHFGREVPRVGVGWYWFGPIAYVDTSDMWLAGRKERVLVSLAGPYASLVVGSVAAIVAWFVPNAVASAALWQFTLISYIGVLANLNPLMEFDGYFVLSDLLDKPNLRPRALSWLGHELFPALRSPGGLKGHRLELLYGLSSMLYIAFSAVLTVILYRLVVQGWLARHPPRRPGRRPGVGARSARCAPGGGGGGRRDARRSPSRTRPLSMLLAAARAGR